MYLGRFRNSFKIAVKCLVQTEQIKKEDLIKQFENEVKTLSTYRHENVVHLLGYSIDGPSPCLVSMCVYCLLSDIVTVDFYAYGSVCGNAC